jgi:hypothetical protein
LLEKYRVDQGGFLALDWRRKVRFYYYLPFSWDGRKWDWKPPEVFLVERDATVAITPVEKWGISALDSTSWI